MELTITLFVIGVLLIVVEMFSGTLSLLWIGMGFVLTSGIQYLFENIVVSTFFFILSMVIAYMLTKAFKKRKQPSLQSGVYSYIGREVKVLDVVQDDCYRGTVGINGEVWNVVSKEPLESGHTVTVTKVEGSTLFVEQDM